MSELLTNAAVKSSVQCTLQVKLSLFVAVILVASIIVLSQIETIEKDKRYMNQKPSSHIAQRKLQAIFGKKKRETVHANATTSLRRMDEENIATSSHDVNSKFDGLAKPNTQSIANYSAIILKLLKENQELQLKFNETLQLLKNCAYDKTAYHSRKETIPFVSSDAERINANKSNVNPGVGGSDVSKGDTSDIPQIRTSHDLGETRDTPDENNSSTEKQLGDREMDKAPKPEVDPITATITQSTSLDDNLTETIKDDLINTRPNVTEESGPNASVVRDQIINKDNGPHHHETVINSDVSVLELEDPFKVGPNVTSIRLHKQKSR